MDMLLEADLAYAIEAMGGKLKPGTKVTINQVDQEDSPVGLELRAILTEAIPATEFGLKWKTSRLLDVTDKDGKTTEADPGIVTLWTKITY